jgi:hypothetical protein
VCNHEALEVSWDAQADIEEAMLRNLDLLFAAVDYFKYFDSFDHHWVHGFLLKIGFPNALVDMVLNMYVTIQRYIKLGKAYGLAQEVYNGMGQGDHAALFPAVGLVSGQFYMIDLLYPAVNKGACIDDRNFRGSYEDVIGTYHAVYDFDIAAGHMLQASKNVMMATTQKSRDKLKQLTLHGHKVSCPDHTILTGDVISTQLRKFTEPSNQRILAATCTAARISRAPVDKQLKVKAIGTAAIPKAIFATQWNIPSFPALSKLRTVIMQGTWGSKARMRCLEILMTVSYDPARIDPYFAALYRSFTLLRRVLLKSEARYHMFCRNILHASVQRRQITGPVHGFVDACDKLGIDISRHGEDLYITSP